jgi:8-oxo-dGTP pyrophosphatase MutT (NUDIX family)
MAYFNKVGLLILNDDATKFLVCEKSYFTTDFIMPGGRIEPGENHVECLVRELHEELQVDIDHASLEFLGNMSTLPRESYESRYVKVESLFRRIGISSVVR